MRPIIVVQARYSSVRLPGKVLREVAGVPLLGHQLNRLERSEEAAGLMVATSTESSDDILAAWCAAHSVAGFRGDLNNVAARLEAAGIAVGANPLVRLCGDSPLIDPALVDRVIQLYAAQSPDLATNVFPRSFPKGQSVEAIDPDALARALPKMNAADREHVTRPFYREPDAWSIASLAGEIDASAHQLSVDTEADLAALTPLLETMPEATWDELVAALTEPDACAS